MEEEEEEEEEEEKRVYICKCCCRLMPVSSLFIHSKTRHQHQRKELGKKRGGKELVKGRKEGN